MLLRLSLISFAFLALCLPSLAQALHGQKRDHTDLSKLLGPLTPSTDEGMDDAGSLISELNADVSSLLEALPDSDVTASFVPSLKAITSALTGESTYAVKELLSCLSVLNSMAVPEDYKCLSPSGASFTAVRTAMTAMIERSAEILGPKSVNLLLGKLDEALDPLTPLFPPLKDIREHFSSALKSIAASLSGNAVTAFSLLQSCLLDAPVAPYNPACLISSFSPIQNIFPTFFDQTLGILLPTEIDGLTEALTPVFNKGPLKDTYNDIKNALKSVASSVGGNGATQLDLLAGCLTDALFSDGTRVAQLCTSKELLDPNVTALAGSYDQLHNVLAPSVVMDLKDLVVQVGASKEAESVRSYFVKQGRDTPVEVQRILQGRRKRRMTRMLST
ncbi:hypothetical protein BT69DRAFT_697233 [Atractiella rhizophila]|nr:hypothetical protein BT69DRAFT_697233 [Atractiella rhizophila]